MLDGRVLEASQVEYEPFGKTPLKREVYLCDGVVAEQRGGDGPPSITGRLRSAADGAQAAADLVGAGAAGLAAVQLPQDAAEYVRRNVLPRSGPQPPPQIIGRPSDVERLLDEAGPRTGGGARRSAGNRDGSGGSGGGRGGRCRQGLWLPGAHRGRGCWNVGWCGGSWQRLAVGLAGGAAYGLARGTGWVAADVRSANNMNDATQPQHFTLRTGSSTSGSPASSRSPASACRRSPTTTRRAPSPGA